MPHVRDIHDVLVSRENLNGIPASTPALALEAHELVPGDLVNPAIPVVGGAADAHALVAGWLGVYLDEKATRSPNFNQVWGLEAWPLILWNSLEIWRQLGVLFF
ncbi:hypothetical protein HBO38_04015 [Pseudomonas veronii]|uniref:Uncharacterized protein n=1 Tax=Pseudomonas veronii TaxID=76761 RepID=A0A7Y1A1R3_PSEVE|nr:hypothetical protein [Pseudomonas veronii]NMY07622.1 hypothetical protein [Pseudomonas veronii]